jgi:hypothetical protein
MNTKTTLLALAIAISFAGVASAQDAATTTTTVVTTPATPPADTSDAVAPDNAATTTTTVVTTPAAAPADTSEAAAPEPATAATPPMSELDIRNALTSQGYTHIKELKLNDGMWTAEAKSADGKKVDLRVDGMTGKAIPDEPVSSINKDAVIAKLLAANYTNVNDVKFEDGIWTADAKDSSGAEVEVKLDGSDGHILGVEKDKADEKTDSAEKKDTDEKEDSGKTN